MNLRLIFVLLIIVAGSFYSALGAFEGLLFYLWYAYFRPDYWTYGPLIASLNLSLIIAIYVVLRTIMRLPNLRISLGTILIWLFFFQAFVGTISSESPILSWAALDVFFRVVLFAYLIVILVTDRKKFRLVLLVMSLSLGFDLAKQGWGDLWFSPGRKNENTVAFLGDNNGVAMGLLMLFPLTNALVHTSARKWEKYVHRFFAVGVLLRAISTYSRGGFLGAGALAVLTIIRSEKKIRAAVGTVVLVFCVAQIMPQEFWDRMDTITVEEGETRDDSSEGRLHFWEVAVHMANAKPMTGVGLGAYNSSYTSYNYEGTFPGERAAHSVWFGVLGELGYPGLIILIANIVWSFWCCWRVHRIARKQAELRELRVYANALISSLVVFCVSGTFLSAQTSEMFWHMVGLSTALRFIATEEREAFDSTNGQLQKVA
jgi:probable O-glycosylation ligase (exosortase A-associated)